MFSRIRLCVDVLAAFASAVGFVVTLVEPAFFLGRGSREWQRRPGAAAPGT